MNSTFAVTGYASADIKVEADYYQVDQAGALNFYKFKQHSGRYARTESFAPNKWTHVQEVVGKI